MNYKKVLSWDGDVNTGTIMVYVGLILSLAGPAFGQDYALFIESVAIVLLIIGAIYAYPRLSPKSKSRFWVIVAIIVALLLGFFFKFYNLFDMQF